jgi:HEAT repeat protein
MNVRLALHRPLLAIALAALVPPVAVAQTPPPRADVRSPPAATGAAGTGGALARAIGGTSPNTAPEGRDADAELALEAAMLAGGERGARVAGRVIDGDFGPEVKGRALFVLSQIDPAAAEQAIEKILAGPHPVDLKRQAISLIGIGGRPESLQRLITLLPSLREPEVRGGVVDALLIAGRGDLLLDLARQAPDVEIRRRAIQALGAVGGVEDLATLYPALRDVEARRDVLQALGAAGAVPQLEAISRAETDPELRMEAIRALGISGGDAGRAGILAAFRSATTPEQRQTAIEALMISGATDELVALYREARDVDARRQIMRAISASDPDRALDLIDESLK